MPSYYLRSHRTDGVSGPHDATMLVEMAADGRVHPEDKLQLVGSTPPTWTDAWRFRELFPREVTSRYEAAAPNPQPLVRSNVRVIGPPDAPQKSAEPGHTTVALGPHFHPAFGGGGAMAGCAMTLSALVFLVCGIVWLVGLFNPGRNDHMGAIGAMSLGAAVVLVVLFERHKGGERQKFASAFQGVRVGMSIPDVQSLLGQTGAEVGQAAVPNPSDPGEFLEATTWTWKGADGSQLTVVAVSGLIITKNFAGAGSE